MCLIDKDIDDSYPSRLHYYGMIIIYRITDIQFNSNTLMYGFNKNSIIIINMLFGYCSFCIWLSVLLNFRPYNQDPVIKYTIKSFFSQKHSRTHKVNVHFSTNRHKYFPLFR